MQSVSLNTTLDLRQRQTDNTCKKTPPVRMRQRKKKNHSILLRTINSVKTDSNMDFLQCDSEIGQQLVLVCSNKTTHV